jgi:predicted homoserine dehydrogenase-like protein
VYGKLMPAADSLAIGALPLGLAHQAKLLRAVAAGRTVRRDDVALDDRNLAARARGEMEQALGAPTSRAA